MRIVLFSHQQQPKRAIVYLTTDMLMFEHTSETTGILVRNAMWTMHGSTKVDLLERMLTVRQVADFLHVSICSVRRWSDMGALRFYRVGTRGDRRYRHQDVLRFLEESSDRPRTAARKENAPRTRR